MHKYEGLIEEDNLKVIFYTSRQINDKKHNKIYQKIYMLYKSGNILALVQKQARNTLKEHCLRSIARVLLYYTKIKIKAYYQKTPPRKSV